MLGGNVNDFVNRIYSGQDTVFVFEKNKYWFQGYSNDTGGWHMEIFQIEPSENNGYLWTYEATDIEQCLYAFENAPIWNGKTFWEIENEIEWVDG